MLYMRRPLRPAGMAGVHFETASIDRKKIEHFVELMNLGTQLLCQIEIIGRQLVLGVVAASDTAVAARDTAASTRADPAKVWIVGLDARLPK